ELLADLLELHVRRFSHQSQKHFVAVVAHGVIVAEKVRHLAYGFVHIVRNLVEREIVLADEPTAEELLADVILPAAPVIAAGTIDENDRHGHALAGLHERENFEPLVHRSETAGEERDRVTGAHKHQLAREEVFEIDELWIAVDEGIGFLPEWQPNRKAKRWLSPRAAMPGGHDPAASAGDDHPPGGGHHFAEFGGGDVIVVRFLRARRAED